jgi:hypothetical protein
VVVAAALLAQVTACTGADGDAESGRELPVPPNAVPDDTVAVTDAPRLDATDVVLSYAAWESATATVQAGGYVSPVVEDGGTCTLELQQRESTIEVDVPAFADATTTICGGLSVGADRLTPGTWTAVLRYASPTTTGVSEPITVEVPS